MKRCIISDLHYGVRNNNVNVLEHQRRFFSDYFFPLLQAEGIQKIDFLGDLIDNRTSVSHLTYQHLNADFLRPLNDYNFDVDMLVGNHDCYYKSTNSLNFLREYVAKTYPFRIHDVEAAEIGNCLYVPWISRDNHDSVIKSIKNSKAEYCFGHFEINGAETSKGKIFNGGLSPELFQKFRLVLSGHFHNRSNIGHIRFIGNPFAFNWDDYNYHRGFVILDDETHKLKFLKNPFALYSVFRYVEDNLDTDFERVRGTYSRVFVENKKSETKFNDFIGSLNACGPIEVQIIDNQDYRPVEKEFVIDDTQNIFKQYLDASTATNKVDVWNVFQEVYGEAINQ